MTTPLPELTSDVSVPNLRDPDKLVYFRQDGPSLVIGGYERNPASFAVDAIPDTNNPTVQSFDERRWASLLENSLERLPSLAQAKLVKRVNGLESFTPDGEFILGESPDVHGFWVACGFCAHGVSGSGGVGKMIAQWIVAGEPELDLWHMDMRRFGAYTASRRYIATRVHEIYSTYYDISYPMQERSSARKLRLSPVYTRLQELGAVFGEKTGWERPNWFTSNDYLAIGKHWPIPYGWEIYAPMEYGLKLWDTLWQAGQPLGITAAGYRAIELLRLEKGYRYWSTDIHSEYNPYEAGLGFAVKLNKGDFNGREALERIKAEGVKRKLCCLVLDDPRAVALGGEPLLDGERVLGRVTSGSYGYTVRQSIAYGYLPVDYAIPGTKVAVQLFGVRYPATVMKEPLYDPKNEKIKA